MGIYLNPRNHNFSDAECILKVFESTGEKFVILMDEYDVLVRENVGEAIFTRYLDFLNGLFKSDTLRPAIAFAYLTGMNVTTYKNTMNSFNTKNDMLTYLLRLGYLAYNEDEMTCRIPNKEVQQEWFKSKKNAILTLFQTIQASCFLSESIMMKGQKRMNVRLQNL